MGWLHGILESDKKLFLFLNGFYSDFGDTLMFFITRKETWIPLYLILIWYIFKNYRSKGYIIILFMILGVVVSDQLANVIKDSVQRLRPVYEPSIQNLVHNYFRMGGQYGFFSSHAGNAFFVAAFTSIIFKNKIYRNFIIGWALLVSYSRIYLGVHYPLDILGGIVFGVILGWIFYKLMMFVENHFFISRQPKIRKTALPKPDSVYIAVGCLIILVTLLIVSRNLHHYQIL
jgi:undecaprenyl-diphosphatase